jgi:hypothetical protein
MVREKARYFSIRFSALLLERLEKARVGRYGERTSLAEAVRRLLEERLNEVSAPVAVSDGSVLSSSGSPLAAEIAEVAIAVQKLIQRSTALAASAARSDIGDAIAAEILLSDHHKDRRS